MILQLAEKSRVGRRKNGQILNLAKCNAKARSAAKGLAFAGAAEGIFVGAGNCGGNSILLYDFCASGK